MIIKNKLIYIRKYNVFIRVGFLFLLIFSIFFLFLFPGCREYDNKFDAAYFFKTDPEKSVLDFLYALNAHDAEYIYSNLLLDSDRRNISKEKFIEEMNKILSTVENIKVEEIVYLGFENNISKIIVKFNVLYTNENTSSYKKYIYLKEEKNKWKLVLDKTFI